MNTDVSTPIAIAQLLCYGVCSFLQPVISCILHRMLHRDGQFTPSSNVHASTRVPFISTAEHDTPDIVGV